VKTYFDESVTKARNRKLEGTFDDKAMTDAVKDFSEAAAKLERERARALEDNRTAKLKKINDGLLAVERDFIDERGLVGRPWYKHEIYAPGVYTGYASQPLTDFSQALEDRNAANAREGLTRIVAAIKRATETLKRAAD
jgi:N-acetylated-alpha-linked acidic dipeptidase